MFFAFLGSHKQYEPFVIAAILPVTIYNFEKTTLL
ncbi:unnamed protein product [Cylicostephanus goldi]|uniref:Uncharacterized protein n=1 Tax=Cylicostephanus goldi TaxID=71465 RepID=A0A3P7NLF9_CYLGO|nr:unnamed protein product [Cylicostephanus goldi]